MSLAVDDGRPPLAPVGPGRRRLPATQQQVSDGRETEKSNYHNQLAGDEADDIENRFDLMHVKIVIYGLSGVLCQKVDKKKRRLLPPTFPSPTNNSNKHISSPVNKKSEAATPSSSSDILGSDDITFMDVPTTAIVVFERKALSSQTSMFSYLPSLPLGLPTHASLRSSRYAASWPAELHTSYLNENCSAIDRSSFTFTRVMKLESFSRGKKCNGITTYVPETVDLMINLGRGTEMIALGTTSLVITGDEEAEVQLNLPVRQFQFKNKRSFKSFAGCRRKPSFSHDSSNVFVLDDNARLRVGLQVTAQKAIVAAQARAEREQEMMAELEKFVEEITMVHLDLSGDDNSLFAKEITLFGENEKKLLGSPLVSSKSEPSGVLEWQSRQIVEPPKALSPASIRPQTNFFCGAAICNDRGNVVENDNFIFSDLTHRTRSAVCQRREISFRESSVMSSMSESSDESDFTDLGGILNRQIVVLKHKQGVC